MFRQLAIVPALIATVCAVNTIEREFTCPVDAEAFKQRIETAARHTGVRLDLRRLGDVVEPPTMPQCPKCRLVLFMDKWNEPLLAKLKPFILSADYQLIASKNPSYFCLAQIQEFLRAPAIYSGHSYLRASWQVEEKQAARDRCLALALERFSTALGILKKDDAEYANTVLLCGELERRLGKWEAAEARFRALLDDPAFSAPAHRSVIEQQLALLSAKDTLPHPAAGRAKIPGSAEPATPPPDTAHPGDGAAISAPGFAALAAILQGPDEDRDILPDLPNLPAEPRAAAKAERLPEPRILKSPHRKSAPKMKAPAAKAAVIAAPDGTRAKSQKVIGGQ